MPVELYGPVGTGGGGTPGLISINADVTPGQTLFGDANGTIEITDGGAGVHTITYKALTQGFSQFLAPVLLTVPAGVETDVGDGVVGFPGWYSVQVNINNNQAPLPGTMLTIVRIKVGLSLIGSATQQIAPGATVDEWAESLCSYDVTFNGGETITVSLQQDSAASMDVGMRVSLEYLGAL